MGSSHYYFKKIKISAVALIKMVMHARSGGNIEVMGYIQGKVEGDTFFVFDTFILPVEASETRVVALEDSYSYITKYLEMASAVGRNEAAIGWYHSHPGYGCWLSGIDIATQRLQQAAGPFVAIVVKPLFLHEAIVYLSVCLSHSFSMVLICTDRSKEDYHSWESGYRRFPRLSCQLHSSQCRRIRIPAHPSFQD